MVVPSSNRFCLCVSLSVFLLLFYSLGLSLFICLSVCLKFCHPLPISHLFSNSPYKSELVSKRINELVYLGLAVCITNGFQDGAIFHGHLRPPAAGFRLSAAALPHFLLLHFRFSIATLLASGIHLSATALPNFCCCTSGFLLLHFWPAASIFLLRHLWLSVAVLLTSAIQTFAPAYPASYCTSAFLLNDGHCVAAFLASGLDLATAALLAFGCTISLSCCTSGFGKLHFRLSTVVFPASCCCTSSFLLLYFLLPAAAALVWIQSEDGNLS